MNFEKKQCPKERKRKREKERKKREKQRDAFVESRMKSVLEHVEERRTRTLHQLHDSTECVYNATTFMILDLIYYLIMPIQRSLHAYNDLCNW
jgi:hypothetical protein